jgi:hypothetical protein
VCSACSVVRVRLTTPQPRSTPTLQPVSELFSKTLFLFTSRRHCHTQVDRSKSTSGNMFSSPLLLALGAALGAPAADKITSLPGWPAGTPLPEMYSGYVSHTICVQCTCVSCVAVFCLLHDTTTRKGRPQLTHVRTQTSTLARWHPVLHRSS